MARGRRTPHIAPAAPSAEARFVQDLMQWREAELAQPSNAYRDVRERDLDARIRTRIAARMQDLVMAGDDAAIRDLATAADLAGDPDVADIASAIRLHRALLDRGDPLPDDFPESVLRVTGDDVMRAGWQRHGGTYAECALIDQLRDDPTRCAATVEDWARAAEALLYGPDPVTRGATHPMLPIPLDDDAQWRARFGAQCDPGSYLGVIQRGEKMEIWHLQTLSGDVNGIPRSISAGYRLMKISTPDPDPNSQRRWMSSAQADLPMMRIDPDTYDVALDPLPSTRDLGAMLGTCAHEGARWAAGDGGDQVRGCPDCGAHHLDVIAAAALDEEPRDLAAAMMHERFHAILDGRVPPDTWVQARDAHATSRAPAAPAIDLATALFAA